LSITHKCTSCGTLLPSHDVPGPHCSSRLRNITVNVNETIRVEEAGRIIREWFVELTEWVHTLTKTLVKSAGILMNYYLDSFQSNLIDLPLFGLDLFLSNTQFRIPRRQIIEF
jgi:hypothetical protein